MDIVVQTRSGRLRGQLSGGHACFKGVAFAAPPFGRNRLQPPRLVAPWTGVRDALAFGPKAPQGAYPPGIREALAEVAEPGEDCLNLNIWTPDVAARGLPVMVWIPGGMFEFHATGASALYDGGRFARDGVVCVTVGYRVGAEGFLHLPGEVANLGLLDQIAALEWVHDNIAAFGGDPSKVTIVGESAGAMSVAVLLAAPRARGLFHRAVIESGAAPPVNSAATAGLIGRRLAELLGVEPIRGAIAALSPERVVEAQDRLRAELAARPDPAVWGEVAFSSLPWAPTVDGEILPKVPIEAIREGAAANIDLLVGSNRDETRLFLLPDGAIDRIGEEALALTAVAYGLSTAGLDAYRAAHPGASAGELFSAIQTDGYWRIPAVRMADAHAQSARAATYMYEFAWPSPQYGGRLGAAHGLEVPFVFDVLGPASEPMLGPRPPQALADTMHRAWVGFVTSGDCGWPRYDRSRRATMRFDASPTVVDDPLGAVRALWHAAPGDAAAA